MPPQHVLHSARPQSGVDALLYCGMVCYGTFMSHLHHQFYTDNVACCANAVFAAAVQPPPSLTAAAAELCCFNHNVLA